MGQGFPVKVTDKMCNLGLNQENLMEYLDGVADASVVAHVVACRDCRDGVTMLANAESGFREMVSSTLCVDEMMLGEYYLGTLDVEASLAVSLHVQICDDCRARLNTISQFTDGKNRAPVVLYPVLNHGVSNYGLSAVRDSGSQRKNELTYYIREAEINLEVQKVGGGHAIWGLVTGIETDHSLRASLRRVPESEKLAHETSIDLLGDFQFSKVDSGEYELLIDGDDVSYLLRGLSI